MGSGERGVGSEELRIMPEVRLMIKAVYMMAKRLNDDEKYGLQSQIRRAAISVALNITEGNVFFDKRKLTHFERALGSLAEVIECCILIKELYGIECEYNLPALRSSLIALVRSQR